MRRRRVPTLRGPAFAGLLFMGSAAAQITEVFRPCAIDVTRGTDHDTITAVCDRAPRPESEGPGDYSAPSLSDEQTPPGRVIAVSPPRDAAIVAGGREALTLAQCNARAQPGDTCQLAPGDYIDPIRPARSGTAGAWITYQATGKVRLGIQGADQGPESGAVVLTDRQYVRVDGGAKRNFIIKPEAGRPQAGVLLNLHGSNLDIRGVRATCPTPERSCRWVVIIGLPWVEYETPAENIVLSNLWLVGSASHGADPDLSTEDVIAVSHATRVLIQDSRVSTAKHVAVAIGPGTKQIVIRRNRIRNPQHTAVSAWGAGPGLWLDGNDITASAHTLAPAGGPGNALELGASDALFTYNLIRRGGSRDAPDVRLGAIVCASGVDQSIGAYQCHGNRVIGNVLQGYGSTWATLDFAPEIDDLLGDNQIEGNLILGPGQLTYWDRERDTGDVWTGNTFATGSEANSLTTMLFSEFSRELLARAQGNRSVSSVAPINVRRWVRQAVRKSGVLEYRYVKNWPEWMQL